MATERDGVIINVKHNEFWWSNFKDMWANRGLVMLRLSPLWYGIYMLVIALLWVASLSVGDFSRMGSLSVMFVMSFALWSGAYAYRNAFIVEDDGN